MNRRGFLKTIFGGALGAATHGLGDVMAALTTRKASNAVLFAVTGSEICDAKFFVMPYIPLVWAGKATEEFHFEGQLDGPGV